MDRITRLEQTLKIALGELELLRIEHQTVKRPPATPRQNRKDKYKARLVNRS